MKIINLNQILISQFTTKFKKKKFVIGIVHA